MLIKFRPAKILFDIIITTIGRQKTVRKFIWRIKVLYIDVQVYGNLTTASSKMMITKIWSLFTIHKYWENTWKLPIGSFYGNFGYDVTYVRPCRLSGWRWGGRAATRDGSVRAVFLARKRQRCIWQPTFFLRETISVTSNGIKGRKEPRDEATKFEKFNPRNPREKPRKKNKTRFQWKCMRSLFSKTRFTTAIIMQLKNGKIFLYSLYFKLI